MNTNQIEAVVEDFTDELADEALDRGTTAARFPAACLAGDGGSYHG